MPKFIVRLDYDQWDEYEVEAASKEEVEHEFNTCFDDEGMPPANWRNIATCEYDNLRLGPIKEAT